MRKGLPILPREKWVRRLKKNVALSPLGASGGKSTREHRIRLEANDQSNDNFHWPTRELECVTIRSQLTYMNLTEISQWGHISTGIERKALAPT